MCDHRSGRPAAVPEHRGRYPRRYRALRRNCTPRWAVLRWPTGRVSAGGWRHLSPPADPLRRHRPAPGTAGGVGIAAQPTGWPGSAKSVCGPTRVPAVVKPQVAFFEALRRGWPGGAGAHHRGIAGPRVLVLADAKRGDIGSTMAAYAQAWVGRPAGGRCRHRLALPGFRLALPAAGPRGGPWRGVRAGGHLQPGGSGRPACSGRRAHRRTVGGRRRRGGQPRGRPEPARWGW